MITDPVERAVPAGREGQLRTLLLAPDARNSVLAARDRQTRNRAYSAHGYHCATGVVAGALGFNGEYVERHGLYLLGSYRAYSPALKLFCSPDSLSPFGAGGLNPYAYCLGDPVNHVDPTGHMPWWASLVASMAASILTAGIAAPLLAKVGMTVTTAKLVGSATIKVATAATATSVATTVAQEVVSEQAAKDVLGWVSFGSGIVGGVAAGLGFSMKLIERGVIGIARPEYTAPSWAERINDRVWRELQSPSGHHHFPCKSRT